MKTKTKVEVDEPFESKCSVRRGVKPSTFHVEEHRFKSDTEYSMQE